MLQSRVIAGNFGAAGSDLRLLGGAPYENCFFTTHNVENRRDGCIIGVVFEPKRRFQFHNLGSSTSG